MKNILLLLLVFSYNLFAQDSTEVKKIPKIKHSFTIGVDIANTFSGGTVNGRALDFQGKYTLESLGNQIEFGLFYERFPKLNFEAYGMIINKLFKKKDFEFALGLEQMQIHRWNGLLFAVPESHRRVYAYGANLEIRYNFNNRWAVVVQNNLRRRLDIGTKWLGSNWINLRYTIQDDRRSNIQPILESL